MESYNSLPQDVPQIDQEKEKIKEKIAEILVFPFYQTRENKDIEIDPKKFSASNPSLEEFKSYYEKNYHVVKVSSHDIAQLCYVIIGEQPAYDGFFLFDDEESLDNFLKILSSLGVLTEVVRRSDLLSKLATEIVFARSKNDLISIKEVDRYVESDINKYHREYGRLMGFPETAIKAFVGETERLKDPLKYWEEKDKYPQYSQEGGYLPFAYSKDNVEEEHAYFLDRNRRLREYAPQLFKD